MTTATKLSVVNIVDFPNGLGFTATVSGTRFEINVDRAIKRLSAWRTRSGELTHFWEISGFESIPESKEGIAELIGLMWRDRRSDWIDRSDD